MKRTILFILCSLGLNAVSVQTFSHSISDKKNETVRNSQNENTSSCIKYFKHGLEVDMCFEKKENFHKKKDS